MSIKRIVGLVIFIVHLSIFATTTTTTSNALYDAQNAQANNTIYNQNKIQNQLSNDDLVLFNLGEIMNTAAKGASLMNLGKTLGNMSSSNINFENDTSTNPSLWKKVKLKPWQVILVAIFIAREVRELKESGGNNSEIENPNFESSPIGKIKDTSRIESKIVVNLFKITGNITDKVGRTLSNILALFLLLMGTLEVFISILKNITGTNSEDSKTILMIFKDMFSQITLMGIVFVIMANGFFWNFYTGPLFNLAMKVGGMLSNQKFDMYNLSDYISKLLRIPFTIILSGVKMMFSIKGVVNNIMPMIVLFSGIMIFFLIIRSVVEIMMVLVDYLVIGCFFLVVIVFVVLKITKNIGSGAVGAVIAAMINVIIMFSLIGLVFSLVDNLDATGVSDVSKLIGIIINVFIITSLLMNIKNIGSALNVGSTGFVNSKTILENGLQPAYLSTANIVGNPLGGVSDFFKKLDTFAMKKDEEKSDKENSNSNKSNKKDKNSREKKIADERIARLSQQHTKLSDIEGNAGKILANVENEKGINKNINNYSYEKMQKNNEKKDNLNESSFGIDSDRDDIIT